MTAHIIAFEPRKPNPGNAREAMAEVLALIFAPMGDVLTDEVLAGLWAMGFKVVPLDGPEPQ